MRPQVSEQQARELAEQLWGFQIAKLSELDGYDDRNLKLEGPDGRCCVMKVHNAADSRPEVPLPETQNALLTALAAASIPVPAPLPLRQSASGSSTSSSSGTVVASADGATVRFTAPDGQVHAVRLLTWLPGSLLADVPQSLELCRQLGALLARVDLALQQDAGLRDSPVLRRPYDWNLQQLAGTYARVRPGLLQLDLPGLDVPLLDVVVEHFAAATQAAGPQLREAIVHSDANEKNVLVHAAGAAAAAAACDAAVAAGAPPGSCPGSAASAAAEAVLGPEAAAAGPHPLSDGRRTDLISGLIDWGDATWQWLAGEPAAAAVYLMLLDAHIADPLPAVRALLSGYERLLPLLPGERRLLRTLCMGRLAQSLSLGAAAAAREPDNVAYLLATQRNGWRLLRALWSIDDAQFMAGLAPPVCGLMGPPRK